MTVASFVLAQVYSLHAVLVGRVTPDMCSLLPRFVNHWWPIIEDIFQSPKILSYAVELNGRSSEARRTPGCQHRLRDEMLSAFTRTSAS